MSWKGYMTFRKRPDLKMYVVDTDFGVGIIEKGNQKPVNIPISPTYYNLLDNREKWLNLVNIQQFKKTFLCNKN